jgi:hypothetical protein
MIAPSYLLRPGRHDSIYASPTQFYVLAGRGGEHCLVIVSSASSHTTY